MKKVLTTVLMALSIVSCGGGGQSQASTAKPTFNYKVETIALPVGGTPSKNHLRFNTWKGTLPGVIYRANPNSSVDIAWKDTSNDSIRITQIDSEGNLIAEFKLSGLPKIGALLGFTKITTDNSFTVAYSTSKEFQRQVIRQGKPKTVTDRVGYFHLARVDSMGQKMWSKEIFGEGYTTRRKSFNPGSNSTSRLEYDKDNNALVYFMGKNRRFKYKSHQGSTLGIHDANTGNALQGRDWMVSHDFDMRLHLDQGKYYLFGHGDMGPVGLYAAAWQLGKNKKGDGFALRRTLPPTNYSKAIKGNRRLNITNHSLGDVLKLGNGKFISVFAKGKDHFQFTDRGTFNAYFARLETKSEQNKSHLLPVKTKQLTNTGEREHIDNVRVAKYGDNILIAWHKIRQPYAYIGEYDENGNVLSEPKMIDGVALNGMYGLINLPNGNVFWATPSKDNRNQFDLHIIKK